MYLQDFTREFRIDELVRFETEVVRVRLVKEEKWKIKSKQRSGKEMGLELDEIFDAVVVCNGHFTEPRVAYIPGIFPNCFFLSFFRNYFFLILSVLRP